LIVRDCCVDKLRNHRLHYRYMRGLTTLSGLFAEKPSFVKASLGQVREAAMLSDEWVNTRLWVRRLTFWSKT